MNVRKLFAFLFCLSIVVQNVVADEALLKEEKSIPLPFASERDLSRGYVDIPVDDPRLVAEANAFRIEFDCEIPEAVGSITFYVRCGNGWRSSPVNVEENDEEVRGKFRTTVSHLSGIEGTPGPLDKADTIRLAFWRGATNDTTLRLRKVDAVFFPVLAIRSDDDRDTGAAKSMIDLLNRTGIPTGTISQDDLNETRLTETRVVVMPCTSGLKPEAVAVLRQFVERGGKLVAFYQLHGDLMNALGFQPGPYIRSPEGDAALAEVRFVRELPDSDPFSRVPDFKQRSWNIIPARPLHDRPFGARISAWWFDVSGRKTEYPALLTSDRGAFFSHILTNEDSESKNVFLLELFGQYDPSLGHRAVVRAWRSLFRIGDPRKLTEENRALRTNFYLAELKRRGFDLTADVFREDVDENVAKSISGQNRALLAAIREIRQEEIRTVCESIPAKTPEFRAWWEHAGLGAYPGDWDRTMKELSEAGFNAVISNLLWGGSGHYPSDVIERSAKFRQYGDQVEQAIQAGKKYGVEVHAWQVCYRLTGSTPKYVEKMKQAGRTQKRFDGTDGDWLCPSHPENVDLECATFCELVRNYPDLAGIHYDYIRYPDGEHCFCEGCRDRFAEETGLEIARWPDDVLHGGAHRSRFEDWRCETITRLVECVHREAKAIRPTIKISAAVFSDYPGCRRGVGQDWPLWVEKGYLDFICPMNYTENLGRFESLTKRQKELIDGRIPHYPGIGATATGIAMTPDRVALEIEIARQLESPGFVIFNLDGRTIQTIPPMLKLGPTRKGKRAP